MRHILLLPSAALLLAAPLSRSQAQESLPPSAAGSAARTVVSYEISAALVTRRAPNEWIDAVPTPLLDEIEADEHFGAFDVGGLAGNGILIRFDFDDMDAYRTWNDSPEVQQMLAEIGQAIGYGYSRSSISMRRVPLDFRAAPAAPRRAPAAPRAAPPAPAAPPQSAARVASHSS